MKKGYEKWERGGGGGGGGGGAGGGSGAPGGAWASRERERDRERERQARAHQMSQTHAAEPDASSLFPAPFRVTGHRDKVSQQIQTKLGDYHLAQTFIDDPSKSIGICAEPPSPAPCLRELRRESEFKKPAHAPQNGRIHSRHYPGYNKSDGSSSGAPVHRPPPLRIPNGISQSQSAVDCGQPHIESILKEMKSIPTPLTVIAATPRKELENKFIFDPHTNKVQENPQLSSTDLKSPLPKPGSTRISNSRSSVSPDVPLVKEVGLSESDDEVAASTHRIGPPLSPIGSGSPTSGSSSQSDSESESSSAESSAPAPPPPAPASAPAPATAPAVPQQRPSWSLVNFAPPPAQPLDQPYDSGKELRHALADVKGKPITNILYRIMYEREDDVMQKWIKLALFKSNLRLALRRLEESLRCHVPLEDRRNVLEKFYRLKDGVWQAIGALHGTLASVVSEQSPLSDLSDSEASSPSPSSRRRSHAARTSTASSDEDTPTHHTSPRVPRSAAPTPTQKRGRPPKARPEERAERPPKKKRGRPPKPRPPSPPTRAPPPDPEPEPPHHHAQETKTHILSRVFTPKKTDEGGGKGGKGGKGKGGKGKAQVTVDRIEVERPEAAEDAARRKRHEEAMARVSPPGSPPARRRPSGERDHRREDDRHDRHDRARRDRRAGHDGDRFTDRTSERSSSDRSGDRLSLSDRRSTERLPDKSSLDRAAEKLAQERLAQERERLAQERLAQERLAQERLMQERIAQERLAQERLAQERLAQERLAQERIMQERERLAQERLAQERLAQERLAQERLAQERLAQERLAQERLATDKLHERLDVKSPMSRIPESKLDRHDSKMSIDRLTEGKMSMDRVPDRLSDNKMSMIDSKLSIDRLTEGKMSIERLDSKMSIDRIENKMAIDRLTDSKLSLGMAEGRLSDSKLALGERFVRAEADVGSALKPGRGSERLEEATSIVSERRKSRVLVRVPLARLRADTLRALQRPRRPQPARRPPPPSEQLCSVAATNHERTGAAAGGQTPVYYSYFERLPADALSDEERDHKYYLEEATRLRTSAETEQEPLTRVMLYLESVLCFVLTGRVLELELDTKQAFTIYRETIEYIKLIHSMPQRYRASPHDTFNKLDILGLRVQALLYLRMFKMYNREVKEYNKIVTEYQQKPACAESASPLSPTPSPAGSVGSVGSAASASSGYCSLVHSVPAHAHQALLLLTKYYAFLYVAHDLWERADGLCRLKANQDLFIAVDRKCGPLSLSSTFRHLVQYVRYAITLLKSDARAPRD